MHFVKLITDLAQSYIRESNTIILTCIDCSDNIENQKARQMARQVDPKGNRTIAVLTKPDLTEDGQEDFIESVLAGLKHSVNYGYYVVKNRTHSDLVNKVSADDARKKEEDFFCDDERVGQRLKAVMPDRCGSENFCARLRELLQAKVNEQLPLLFHNLVDKRNHAQQELDDMPPAITAKDAMFVVPNRLSDIQEQFTKNFDAKASKFVSGKAKNEKFARSIHRTQVAFDYGEFSDASKNESAGDTYLDPKVYNQLGKKYKENDVERMVDANRGRAAKLPYGPAAYNTATEIFKTSCEHWLAPLENFIEDVKLDVQFELTALFKKHLGVAPHLYRKAVASAYDLLEMKTVEARNEARKLVEMESGGSFDVPFQTNNHKYLEETCNQTLAKQVSARAKQAITALGENPDSAEIVQRVMMHIQEVDIVASIATGYWTVAYKRFTDVATNRIDKLMWMEVAQEIVDKIRGDVWENLDSELLKKLVAESPQLASKRDRLTNTIKRTDEAITLMKQTIDMGDVFDLSRKRRSLPTPILDAPVSKKRKRDLDQEEDEVEESEEEEDEDEVEKLEEEADEDEVEELEEEEEVAEEDDDDWSNYREVPFATVKELLQKEVRELNARFKIFRLKFVFNRFPLPRINCCSGGGVERG